MRIFRASPFDRPMPGFPGFTAEDQGRLTSEWIVLSKAISTHQRRIARSGPETPLDYRHASAAKEVRDYHKPPLPVDPILVGIREVLVLKDLAEGPVIDPEVYVAAWLFPGNAAEQLAYLGLFTKIPDERLVFFWRGLWGEARIKLSQYALDEAEIGRLASKAQSLEPPRLDK